MQVAVQERGHGRGRSVNPATPTFDGNPRFPRAVAQAQPSEIAAPWLEGGSAARILAKRHQMQPIIKILSVPLDLRPNIRDPVVGWAVFCKEA